MNVPRAIRLWMASLVNPLSSANRLMNTQVTG
jgi:hypothetical protein